MKGVSDKGINHNEEKTTFLGGGAGRGSYDGGTSLPIVCEGFSHFVSGAPPLVSADGAEFFFFTKDSSQITGNGIAKHSVLSRGLLTPHPTTYKQMSIK